MKEFSSIRTGRATLAILDNVFVLSYGAKMPINQIASIVGEGPRSLRITPWNMSQAKDIEKAIAGARLGVSLVVDDKGVRVTFPELTGESRETLMKLVKQKLEDARVAVRTEREKVWEDIQKKEKNGEMGEDDKFRLKSDMQKTVDEANKSLDAIALKKEAEVMS